MSTVIDKMDLEKFREFVASASLEELKNFRNVSGFDGDNPEYAPYISLIDDAIKVKEYLKSVFENGQESATKAAQEKPQKKTDQQDERGEIPKMNDDYIVVDLTGDIITQKGCSLYQRAQNISLATGQMIDLEDEALVEVRNQYVKRFANSISDREEERLKRLYGDDWRQILIDAYESGFKIGMSYAMQSATTEGLKKREQLQQDLAKGEDVQISPVQVDLDKLKFAYENFEVKDGQIVDKKTGNAVKSSQTKNMVIFVNEWVKASSLDDAFGERGQQMFALLSNQAKTGLQTSGIIDVDALKVDASIMGNGFEETFDKLFADESYPVVDQFFRMVVPDAKPYPPQIQEESSAEKKTSL